MGLVLKFLSVFVVVVWVWLFLWLWLVMWVFIIVLWCCECCWVIMGLWLIRWECVVGLVCCVELLLFVWFLLLLCDGVLRVCVEWSRLLILVLIEVRSLYWWVGRYWCENYWCLVLIVVEILWWLVCWFNFFLCCVILFVRLVMVCGCGCVVCGNGYGFCCIVVVIWCCCFLFVGGWKLFWYWDF